MQIQKNMNDYIINRINIVIKGSKSFGHVVANLAKDMGIDIGLENFVAIDIVKILPSVENIGLVQFRIVIVTAIVRYFDIEYEHKDTSRTHYFKSMFDKFSAENKLTTADIQGYQTMMFLLRPKKAKVAAD
jgi:hypothetical protein